MIKAERREPNMNQDIQQFKAEFFKALAHPLRIRILELLVEGDKNVNEIQTLVGSEGSAVSQQLTVLRKKYRYWHQRGKSGGLFFTRSHDC